MSRLTTRINNLKSSIASLEDQLSVAEAKLTRRTFKKNRKAYRKRLAASSMHNRAVVHMLASLERDLFTPKLMLNKINPLSMPIQTFCSDCSCGKAEGCR